MTTIDEPLAEVSQIDYLEPDGRPAATTGSVPPAVERFGRSRRTRWQRPPGS